MLVHKENSKVVWCLLYTPHAKVTIKVLLANKQKLYQGCKIYLVQVYSPFVYRGNCIGFLDTQHTYLVTLMVNFTI